MEHEIHALERVERELAHAGLHQVGGVEQTGQVVEDVLGVALGPEADYGQPGGLGACGLTMARCWPMSALSKEDLPTLGAPARAMWPVRGMGEGVSWEGPSDGLGTGGDAGEVTPSGAAVARCLASRAKKSRIKGPLEEKAGDGLLSHHLAMAVPSALQGLTAVFGMGTGVAPAR